MHTGVLQRLPDHLVRWAAGVKLLTFQGLGQVEGSLPAIGCLQLSTNHSGLNEEVLEPSLYQYPQTRGPIERVSELYPVDLSGLRVLHHHLTF